MGARGPAPKPTAIKQLQGNPGKRALNANEPRPDARRAPSAPRWLSVEGKREWKRIAPRLFGCGLLTEVDGVSLALLCEALAQYVSAKEIVDKEGTLARSDKGNWYLHPAVGVMTSARGEVLKWAREFGMTPAARSRISVETKEEELSLADLLFEAVGGR